MSSRSIRWMVGVLFAAIAFAGAYLSLHRWRTEVAASVARVAQWLDPSLEWGHARHSDRAPFQDSTLALQRIQLSDQAQQNIGLATIILDPSTFPRTINVPGIVIEKPGHSDVDVTAPISGVIAQVYPLSGETLEPGDPLFRLRLTHEEIVQAQAALLKTTEELEVVAREIDRLDKITEGVVPGRTKVEREYERQKLQAFQHAQMQALILHGLGEDQVQKILDDRRLLQEVLIFAPGLNGQAVQEFGRSAGEKEAKPLVGSALGGFMPFLPDGSREQRHSDLAPPRPRRFFEMESLLVEPGQHVDVGRPLCRLGDHTSLYIEGRAFERDAQLLTNSLTQGWPVAAAFETGEDKPLILTNLRIVYIANAVDKDSRAFPFYVDLPNEVARDARTPEGHRFLSWKYKPGQRVQLIVTVEKWSDRLVVPVNAVVNDGAETYVFQRNGDVFERRTVHVEYQDQRYAVLANDGSVFKGEAIVVTGAYQLHLAMKNYASGAGDAHRH